MNMNKRKSIVVVAAALFALALAGCTSLPVNAASFTTYFDENLPPEQTALLYSVWTTGDFTIKVYNGIPLQKNTKNFGLYALPLGKAVFELDAIVSSTTYVGKATYFNTYGVRDVELEVDLTESGNLKTREGVYYYMGYVGIPDGAVGTLFTLYECKGGKKVGRVFKQFRQNGKLVWGEKYKGNRETEWIPPEGYWEKQGY